MALTMKPMTGQAQHDHAAMHGMNTKVNMSTKPEGSPAMCSPGGAAAGPGKMPCSDSCPCMNKMKKDKEAT
jgi:hypothetical protein